MALLFALGSVCFVLGSLPPYFHHVDASVVGLTFFVGSILFTVAASVQLRTSATTGPVFSTAPARVEWWSAAVQWIGTLCFNVSTLAALLTGLSASAARRLVWSPDFYGSAAFLVSSGIALIVLRLAPGTHRDRGIAWLNMTGSISFGIAAIAAFVLPRTGEPISIQWVNLGTAVGGVCFFAASVWMARPIPGPGPTGGRVGRVGRVGRTLRSKGTSHRAAPEARDRAVTGRIRWTARRQTTARPNGECWSFSP